MNTHRQPLAGLFRLLVLAVVSVLLTGCGSLVTIVTATPSEAQNTALAVTSAPTDNATGLSSATAMAQATRRPTTTTTTTPTFTAAKSTRMSAATRTPTPVPSLIDGFRTIMQDDLPPEAQKTLALIDRGGPFPYSRDGIVFQNREGILPKKSASYYHEYTVVTPGSSDRGARRLIAGSKGEIYYTGDHYVSFARVIR